MEILSLRIHQGESGARCIELIRRRGLAIVLGVALGCGESQPNARSGPVVRVGVAANFAAAQAELTRRFETETPYRIETSLGATGQLYAQIVNGAPYDIFLAADTTRPALLETNRATVAGSRFTYAIGRLALYAPGRDLGAKPEPWLRAGELGYLAIANPETAPYGAAARAVLQQWGLWESLEDRIVRGEDVGQALQFVESGAAEGGFIALSQLTSRSGDDYWVVPEDLYDPIRQDAVLLLSSAERDGALAFLAFLRSEEGRAMIADFGYGIP